MASVRYVAIGDSFTEGVGDELPDGTVRGWADLAAQGWADAAGEPIEYANLAIRGKLIEPIVAQQLEPALALKPTHLSFNGGGNDMLRPRTGIERIVDLFDHVVRRCDEEGVQLIVLSGANPSAGCRSASSSKRAATASLTRSRNASRHGPTCSRPTTGSTGSWRARSSGRWTACT